MRPSPAGDTLRTPVVRYRGQDGLRHARRPNKAYAFGFPKMLERALAKIDIRSNKRADSF